MRRTDTTHPPHIPVKRFIEAWSKDVLSEAGKNRPTAMSAVATAEYA